VEDQNAVRAAPRYADGDPERKGMLGSLPLPHSAIPKPKQDAPASRPAQVAPVDQSAREETTAAAQRIVYGEIAGNADLIESFAIGLKEAARRDDRERVHGYLADIVRCIADVRGAYGRIAALAKVGEARQ
jgi:hypothetical protein